MRAIYAALAFFALITSTSAVALPENNKAACAHPLAFCEADFECCSGRCDLLPETGNREFTKDAESEGYSSLMALRWTRRERRIPSVSTGRQSRASQHYPDVFYPCPESCLITEQRCDGQEGGAARREAEGDTGGCIYVKAIPSFVCRPQSVTLFSNLGASGMIGTELCDAHPTQAKQSIEKRLNQEDRDNDGSRPAQPQPEECHSVHQLESSIACHDRRSAGASQWFDLKKSASF